MVVAALRGATPTPVSAVRRGRRGRPRGPPARRGTDRGKYRSSGDGSAQEGSAGRWPHHLVPVAGTRVSGRRFDGARIEFGCSVSALGSPKGISLYVKGSHSMTAGSLLNVLPDVVLYTRHPRRTRGPRDSASLPVRTVSSHSDCTREDNIAGFARRAAIDGVPFNDPAGRVSAPPALLSNDRNDADQSSLSTLVA
jgi:hypothetical protein